jgi:hypothetical protein
VFCDADEVTAVADGCEEPPGKLVFAAAVSLGFGAAEALLIGGELLGALGVEDVVLASFDADALDAGDGLLFATRLDEAGFPLGELG